SRARTAVLHRIAVLADLEREPDPAEVGTETRAPDDVPDVEHPTAVEHREPTVDACCPLVHPLDSRLPQIGPPVTEERRAAVPDLRPHLPSHRRVDGQDVR